MINYFNHLIPEAKISKFGFIHMHARFHDHSHDLEEFMGSTSSLEVEISMIIHYRIPQKSRTTTAGDNYHDLFSARAAYLAAHRI